MDLNFTKSFIKREMTFRVKFTPMESESDDEPPPDLVAGDTEPAAESEPESEPEQEPEQEPEVVPVEHLLEQLRSQHLIARADGIGIALAKAETLRLGGNACLPRFPDEALKAYERAASMLWPFETQADAALPLLLCLSNQAEAYLQLGQHAAAGDVIEDARALIFQRGQMIDQEQLTAVIAKLDRREARAQDAELRERRRMEAAAAARAEAARDAQRAREARAAAEREASERAAARRAAERAARHEAERAASERQALEHAEVERAAAARAGATAARAAEAEAARLERLQVEEERRLQQRREVEERQREAQLRRVAIEEAAAEQSRAEEARRVVEEHAAQEAAAAEAALAREQEAREAAERQQEMDQREAIRLRRRQERQAREDARRREREDAAAAVEIERLAMLDRAEWATQQQLRQQAEQERMEREQEELQLIMDISRREEERRRSVERRAQAHLLSQRTILPSMEAGESPQAAFSSTPIPRSVEVVAETPTGECYICYEETTWRPCGLHHLCLGCAGQWRVKCRSGENHPQGRSIEPHCPVCREPI